MYGKEHLFVLFRSIADSLSGGKETRTYRRREIIWGSACSWKVCWEEKETNGQDKRVERKDESPEKSHEICPIRCKISSVTIKTARGSRMCRKHVTKSWSLLVLFLSEFFRNKTRSMFFAIFEHDEHPRKLFNRSVTWKRKRYCRILVYIVTCSLYDRKFSAFEVQNDRSRNWS